MVDPVNWSSTNVGSCAILLSLSLCHCFLLLVLLYLIFLFALNPLLNFVLHVSRAELTSLVPNSRLTCIDLVSLERKQSIKTLFSVITAWSKYKWLKNCTCHRLSKWYFVTKIVLTNYEKKLFQWSGKTFEIQGWRLRICKIFEITKGQIKSKSRLARRRFYQKTNKRIWFVCC